MSPSDAETIGLTGAYDVRPKSTEDMRPIERHLLCCLLHEPNREIDRANAIITPDSFRWHCHKVTFEAMLAIREKGDPITVATVYESLVSRGQRHAFGEDASGWLYDTFHLEPNGAYASTYARDVARADRLFRLKLVGEELATTASNYAMPPEELGEQAERQIAEITRSSAVTAKVTQMKPLMESTIRGIDEKAANKTSRGLSTGYPSLDDQLGGLRPGQQIIIGARPGGGKTAIGLNIASNVIAAGHAVLFVSAEMPAEQIAERLLSSRSNISMSRLATGRLQDGDAERINEVVYAKGLIREPLMVDDGSDQTAARIRAVARWAVRNKDAKLAVVDYLQLLSPENPKDNRVQQVGTLSRRIKQIARDLGIPIIVLCQLNREVEGREGGKPRLSDLRESGEIEAHADVVLLLHTKPNQEEEAEVWDSDIIIAKQRNGPVGSCRMQYRRPLVRFEERAVGC